MNSKKFYSTIFAAIVFCFSVISSFAQDSVPGTALDFDGANDYVNCGNNASLSFGGTAPFTLEAWVKPNVANADGYIITKYNKNVNGEFRLGIGGGLPWFHREVAPWNIVGTTNLQKDTWYHIAAVYDGNAMVLFVNGDGEAANLSGSISATSNNVLIGAQHLSNVPSGFFNGEIEEVRIWNVARTGPQIIENMHLTMTGSETGLVSYWQFNEAQGTSALDPISSNNGTLVNMGAADWVSSSAPVGGGDSFGWHIARTGIYSFPGTGLSMDIISYSGTNNVTVSRLNLAPNIPPAYALKDTFDNQYWIINRTGDGSYSANLTFTPSEAINSDDESFLNELLLFNRTINSDGSWTYMQSGLTVSASENEVTFNNISTPSQFMIGRKIEPRISRFSPPDDTINVALEADLTIIFDRNISAGSGNIAIMISANDSLFESIQAADATINDSMVIINPTNNFDLSAAYYVLVDSNAFHDGSANYFSGIHDATTWNFSSLGYFSDIVAGLTGVVYSSVAWGDYDNDGDLDILLTGEDASDNITTRIYNNDAGIFTDINVVMPGYGYSTGAWGDYDNDGDLDILLSSSLSSIIYRNDASTGSDRVFTDINAGLPGFNYGSVAWGDYDNDGDLDILIASDAFSSIYRNDPVTGSDRVFTDIDAGLPGVNFGTVDWGDYDNDGDLDILLTGALADGSNISRIYRNDPSADSSRVFIDIKAGLPGIFISSAAWGDYDNDGDLDILMAGFEYFPSPLTRIYRNDPSTGSERVFTDIEVWLPGIISSSLDWGDYDNDGDLDILLTGYTGSILISDIYRNDPAPSSPKAQAERVFTGINAGLTEINIGSAAWGDYDNDGDLDILLTGSTTFTEPVKPISGIYRNNGTIPNNEPNSPEGLSTVISADSVIFSWNKASDNETPENGLSYNLFISNSYFDSLFISPMAELNTGYRSIAAFGNTCQVTSWSYPISHFYSYPQVVAPDIWGVQAIDHAFAGSAFSTDSLNISAAQLQVFNNEIMQLSDSLTWEVAFGDSVFSYQVQIDDDSLFAGMVVNDTLIVSLDGSGQYSIALQDLSGSASLVAGTKYFWRMKPNYSFDMPTLFTTPAPSFWFGFVSGIEEEQGAGIPEEFGLLQNYPNPFNPVTQIKYALPQNAHVKIVLYDMLGRKIKVLVDQQKPAGYHTFKFNAGNLASGLYLYRMNSDDFSNTKKMLLMK